MRKSPFGRVVGFVALTVSIATAALAQDERPVHIRGTVSSIHGAEIRVTMPSGETAVLELREDERIIALREASLEAIEVGTYAGVAAAPGAGGGLTALEVTVFPPSMAGTNEGHFPWDLTADSTMTNARVAQVVDSVDGRTLSLAYDGGRQTVYVPEDVPVVRPEPGSRTLIQPGAHIFALAVADESGHLTAQRLMVGVNGLVPPM